MRGETVRGFGSALVLLTSILVVLGAWGSGATSASPGGWEADDGNGPERTYQEESPWERRSPPDQTGRLFTDCSPQCPIGLLQATVEPASGTADPGARSIQALILGLGSSDHEAGRGELSHVPEHACQGHTPDADGDGVADCRGLTPEDVAALAPDGHAAAVCAYLPNLTLYRSQLHPGPCRDLQLTYEGNSTSQPAWRASLPGTPEFSPDTPLHVVVAPELTPAPCIEPGFEPGSVPAHDVDRIEKAAAVPANRVTTPAEQIVVDALTSFDSDEGPPGFQGPGQEPDEPEDSSARLTSPTPGPGCSPDGNPTSEAPPWRNHVRSGLWANNPMGWWNVETPLTLTGEYDQDPSYEPAHYVANEYYDDLGITRDLDGDDIYDCSLTRSTQECRPMVWDLGQCTSEVGQTGACADDLGRSWGLEDPTGLVMVLRDAPGPLLLWDAQHAFPVGVPDVHVLGQTGEYCIVGHTPGLLGEPELSDLIEEACEGIPESLWYIHHDAFYDQSDLGGFRGSLRWYWPPATGERPNATLELHYLFTVESEGLDIPGGDPLDLGSHGPDDPTVRSVSPATGAVTYDWTDVSTLPR